MGVGEWWMVSVGVILAVWVAGSGVKGHGRLMEPVGRSSAWRKGYDTPVNYNDNELFCGGFDVQFGENGGKCGVCGDNWADPQPRDNEAGGLYGTGLIVANYKQGQEVTIELELTTNHLGYFEYRLCVNNDVTKIITQECLDQHVLQLADGSGTKHFIYADDPKWHYSKVRLPAGVTCTQCVIQWHYKTGNSWGDCGDGSSELACGDQEVFRGCADIGIY